MIPGCSHCWRLGTITPGAQTVKSDYGNQVLYDVHHNQCKYHHASVASTAAYPIEGHDLPTTWTTHTAHCQHLSLFNFWSAKTLYPWNPPPPLSLWNANEFVPPPPPLTFITPTSVYLCPLQPLAFGMLITLSPACKHKKSLACTLTLYTSLVTLTANQFYELHKKVHHNGFRRAIKRSRIHIIPLSHGTCVHWQVLPVISWTACDFSPQVINNVVLE